MFDIILYEIPSSPSKIVTVGDLICNFITLCLLIVIACCAGYIGFRATWKLIEG